MNISISLVEGVIVMFVIIVLAIFLKKLGILSKNDELLFSRIVLYVTLPAVIFSSLAIKPFDNKFLLMAAIMAALEVGIMILAWVIATLLKFKSSEKGALILVSAFGMTALLGYPIIRQVFNGNDLAMEEAVITSEFGVGLLIFILGPIVAEYYGDSKRTGKSIFESIKKFFISPIFFSIVVGIGFSFLPIKLDNQILSTFIRVFKLIGNANLLMVAFTIGLIIEFKKMNNIYIFLGIAILLKLITKPLLAVWLTNIPQFTEMMREIVVIETALPSAILTAVFAKQYNCQPNLVSLTIIVTLVLSTITVSGLFAFVF